MQMSVSSMCGADYVFYFIGGKRVMTIEEMKKRKTELGYSNKTIAELSGVPLGTVQKVFSGATSAPRHETITALERTLSGYVPSTDVKVVSEPLPPYGSEAMQPGNTEPEHCHTLDDYLALSEDVRVEMIDGTFFEMLSPTVYHQCIAGYIYSLLLAHVREHKGPCVPMIAPLDVQLDMDDKTMVQPDVLIVCSRDMLKGGKRVFGAPDFVLEVLSPSTRRKDMFLKLHKYANAGVREYWLIDPDSKTVIQYDLEHAGSPRLYSFEDEVPVLIWNGECKIDMKDMYESMSFLWEE